MIDCIECKTPSLDWVEFFDCMRRKVNDPSNKEWTWNNFDSVSYGISHETCKKHRHVVIKGLLGVSRLEIIVKYFLKIQEKELYEEESF